MNECNYSDSEFTMYTRLLGQHIKPQDFFSLKKNNIEKNQRRRRLKKSLQCSWDVVPKSEKVPGTSVRVFKKKVGYCTCTLGMKAPFRRLLCTGKVVGEPRRWAPNSREARRRLAFVLCTGSPKVSKQHIRKLKCFSFFYLKFSVRPHQIESVFFPPSVVFCVFGDKCHQNYSTDWKTPLLGASFETLHYWIR